MVLSVLATIAILAIAFYNTTQGLFSSMIMTLLTVLCAAFALGFYEPMAAKFYPDHAPYALAMCLMVLFAGLLFALRLGLDIILRPDVIYHIWVDRVAGGLFGLITGIIIVGVATVALQLLPLRQAVFGYRPYDETLQRRQRLGPFYPDEFTLSMVSMLSRGTLGAGNDFAANHRDFALRTFCYRNRAGRETDNACPPDSVKVVGVWQLPEDHPWLQPTDDPEQQTIADLHNPPQMRLRDDDSRIVIVRVAVSRALATRGWGWQLPATNFRLVHPDGRNFYPLAYLTYPSGDNAVRLGQSRTHWRIWRPETGLGGDNERGLKIAELYVYRPSGAESQNRDHALVIDWVYRLPPIVAVDSTEVFDEPDESAPDEPDEAASDEPDEAASDGPDESAPDGPDESAPDEQEQVAPPPPGLTMLLVFRRGVEVELNNVRIGAPPSEGALSHGKPSRRRRRR